MDAALVRLTLGVILMLWVIGRVTRCRSGPTAR